MSEENKIKQFEKEKLDKLIKELKDIDNFKFFRNGSFKYDIGKYQADLLLNYIEQLQQENKDLKKQVEIKNSGFMASIEEVCEYATVLIEFEKWLEEQMNFYKNNSQEYSYGRYKEVMDKLQELKEGNK